MMGWVILAVVLAALIGHGWIMLLWLQRLSAQVATLTLAVREVQDQLETAVDELGQEPPEE